MIYLIGGASRTGKSELAKKILEKNNISWIPLDIIRNAITDLLPKHDVTKGDNSWLTLPERFYPVLEKIIEGINNEKLSFVLEGDCFFPEQIDQLVKKSFTVRACFLGSSTIDAKLLRSMNSNNWHQSKSDTELEELSTIIKKASELFKQKCLENNLRYIDVGQLEDAKFEEAYKSLIEFKGAIPAVL